MKIFCLGKPPKYHLGEWLSTLVVSCSYFSSGMGIAWTSPAFMKMIEGEVDFKLTNIEMSIIASIPFCGRLISPIPMGYVMDMVGRRGILTIGRTLQIIHWVLMYFFHNVWVMYFARFLSGWFSGMSFFIIAVYVGETTRKNVRGRTQALLNINFLLGTVFESALGAVLSYDFLTVASGLFDVITFTFMFMIPESPYHLLKMDMTDEALKSLQWLRGKEDVSKELKKIERYVKRQLSESGSYSYIFKKKATRKAFFKVQILLIIQRSSGMAAIVGFASFLTPDTWWLPNDKGPIALNLTYLISCALTSIFVDYWGRKKFLMVSSFGTAVFMGGCAIWFQLKSSPNYDVSNTEVIPIALLLIQAAFYSTGYFYIPALIMSEMFPMNIKAKANALGAMTATFFTIIIVFIFLPISNSWGIQVNLFIYTTAMVIGGFFSTTLIETKGKSLEAIQALLEGRDPSTSSFALSVRQEKEEEIE